MTNLLLLPGDAAPDDLLAAVADGLYVDTVGHGRMRPEADRYALDVLLGYRIEKGRLTTPVTGLCLEGRLSEALPGIAGIGNDLHVENARGLCKKGGQVVPVTIGMPTVLVTGLQAHPT